MAELGRSLIRQGGFCASERPRMTRTEPRYDLIIHFFSSLHSFHYQTIMVGNYMSGLRGFVEYPLSFVLRREDTNGFIRL